MTANINFLPLHLLALFYYNDHYLRRYKNLTKGVHAARAV